MATRTQAQLIAGARLRANVPNSKFVDDTTELPQEVQASVNRLYDLVTGVYKHYYMKTFTFSLTGGFGGNTQSLSGLTGGFYKDNTLIFNPNTPNFRVVPLLAAHSERDRAKFCYEIVDTPATLVVYPPTEAKGPFALDYTPDPPIVDAVTPLDATLTRWYPYVEISVAIYIHMRRGKTVDAQMLQGDPNNPQVGTIAYEEMRVKTMANNKTELPEQVPMQRRRTSSFWRWDDDN